MLGRRRRVRMLPLAQRVAGRIAVHIPEQLLAEPERFLLNAAAVLLGVAALADPHPGTIVARWPMWFQLEWAVAMIIAGFAALHGAWTGYRPSERLGAGLYALCALAYCATAALRGWSGIFIALIFGGIAVAKALRVIRSLAASGTMVRYLYREERAAKERTRRRDHSQDRGTEPP